MEGELFATSKNESTPTRSEVSDLANAVIDGFDSVMIPENAVISGKAKKSISLYESVIADIERGDNVKPNWEKQALSLSTEMDLVAYYALKTALRVGAEAIVCITKEGNTALRLASFQGPIPIIAATFTQETFNKMSIVRGVQSILLNTSPNLDQILPLINRSLKSEADLKLGDHFVLVSLTISSIGYEASNLFTVQKIT